MKSLRRSAGIAVLKAFLLATVLCFGFYAYRLIQLREKVFTYLPWNLFLAWLPLILMFGLVKYLRYYPWSSWRMIFLTLGWLLFLPNSFYLVSDYIHLQGLASANLLYDVVMFTMFVFTGMLLGYASLYLFHRELLKRLKPNSASAIIALILFICSVAIFIGRDLRWNSWDVLFSPAGLLFDISNRLLDPSSYGDFIGTITIFFALLGTIYLVGWRLLVLSRLADRSIL